MTDLRRLEFVVIGDPVPCQRPRVGRGGTVYMPKETVHYEQHVGAVAHLAAYKHRWKRAAKGTRLIVGLVIQRGKGRRGDIDNIAKSILDGITKAGSIWHDDRDVMRLECTIDDDSISPCVRVMVECP